MFTFDENEWLELWLKSVESHTRFSKAIQQSTERQLDIFQKVIPVLGIA